MSSELTCEFAAIGRVFILRWNGVPNAHSIRAAHAGFIEAWQLAGEQPMVLLLVIASTAGIPDGEARGEMKTFTREVRSRSITSWTVIEADGALATIIKSTIGIIGATTNLDKEWMQMGGTAEHALRALAEKVGEPADALVESARKRKLIA